MNEFRERCHTAKDKVVKSTAWMKLEEAWNENPLTVIAVGAGALIAVSKIIDSVSSARSRRAYAKQVDYRVRGRR
jgi:hypothetical protein